MHTGHARSHGISVKIKMSAPLILTSRSQAADITKSLHAFSVAEFFQNQLFRKILSEIQSGCQTHWIQIRPDVSSGLNWVQTVCKGYQQKTVVGKELNIVFCLITIS